MLDSEHYASLPVWTVTGEREKAAPGFIRRIRLHVAAPSPRGAVACVLRDDPFWDGLTIKVEYEAGREHYAPTRGRILTDHLYLHWRF